MQAARAMKSLARTRALRFEWQKLVTPLTPKAEVAEWQKKQAEIEMLENQAMSVSHTVAPIDWEYWRSAISAPGVVDDLKKEYESLKFTEVSADTEDNKAQVAAIKAELEFSKRQAVHAANEVKEAEKVAAVFQKVKTEGLYWGREQWYDFVPGLREQHRAEYDNEEYLRTDEQMKAKEFDFKAAREALKNGQPLQGIAIDAKIGDLDWEEEKELMAKGRWSIARMIAGKGQRAVIQEKVDKVLAAQ